MVPIHPQAKQMVVDLISSTQCDGQLVSTYAACVNGSIVCTNHGVCNNSGVCVCEANYTGTFCEIYVAPGSGSNTGVIIGAVVGSVVPTLVLIMLAIVVTIMAIVGWRIMKKKDYEWEVDISELELEEQIGMGAFGSVRKAMWKGTEVAVKTLIMVDLPQRAVTREIANSFKEEVRSYSFYVI